MYKVLIVKHGGLGDVIRTSYAVPEMYEKYYPAEIWWFTSNESFDLLRFNPYITRIVTKSYNYHLLLENAFDLLLSFDDEFEILESLTDVSSKNHIGAYLENGKRTYTSSSAKWFDMGIISKFGKSVADDFKRKNKLEHNEIFGEILDIEITDSCFWNSDIFKANMHRLLNKECFVIGLNSGAGGRWPSKELIMPEAIKLARVLSNGMVDDKNIQVVLLGGPKEENRNNSIINAVQSPNIVTFSSMQLLEFAALIACCNYVITCDSLALHLAISQKIPNLSFYAPTSAAEIGVFGTGVKVISMSKDYCSYKPDADNSTITSERILEILHFHLKQTNKTIRFQ
ncbi:MAG: glycosyltransferase family 9 protein [Chitinispirillaceae bacterium]|nr:glycosyltransferase family 9 protein [Chitinispirillaceae bacterium]